MLVEAVEPLLPKTPIRFEPIGDIFQGCSVEFAGAPLCLPSASDQTGALQHFQVLGDRRLADAEGFDQLVDGRLPQAESSQDRAPGWIGEGCEGGGEAIEGHFVYPFSYITYWIYMGDYPAGQVLGAALAKKRFA